jgi:transketolase
VADVLATAYFHALRYRPEDPEWEGATASCCSIGHYAIALYAVLIEAGIVPADELETYGTDDSRLPMSGMAAYTPGMEISGGSLGIGLGIAVGMCLGLKRKGSDRFVYNLMSDGELDEGPTWEAAMSAGHWKLGNLICLVDVNRMQADGPRPACSTPSRCRRSGKRSAGTRSGWTATTSRLWCGPSTRRARWKSPSRA